MTDDTRMVEDEFASDDIESLKLRILGAKSETEGRAFFRGILTEILGESTKVCFWSDK
jgi:hypothetical protein